MVDLYPRSKLLFNMALGKVIRDSGINRQGALFNSSSVTGLCVRCSIDSPKQEEIGNYNKTVYQTAEMML